MKKIWTKTIALDLLKSFNSGHRSRMYSDNIAWYERHNLIDLRDFIFDETLFLNDFDVNYAYRLFCFRLGITEAPLCKFCKLRLCKRNAGLVTFYKTCGDRICLSQLKKQTSKETYKAMSFEKRIIRASKIGKANSGSLESKYDEQKVIEIKRNISNASKGRLRTEETKQKHKNSLKERKLKLKELGQPWHSIETIEKIRASNISTHSHPDYEIIHAAGRAKARISQSITMKNKILNGEFTPSSNYNRASRVIVTINGKKNSFRSSWEAAYFCVMHDQGIELRYELIRIPYHYNDNEFVYIVDFVTNDGNLVEIKPKSRCSFPKEISKFEAARNWCIQRNKIFHIIDESWFMENSQSIVKSTIINNHPEIINKLKGLLNVCS